MEQVTLDLLGRQLVELRETVELQTAILMRIDGTLQDIAAENCALLRRDARQNRDLDELREWLAILEAQPRPAPTAAALTFLLPLRAAVRPASPLCRRFRQCGHPSMPRWSMPMAGRPICRPRRSWSGWWR